MKGTRMMWYAGSILTALGMLAASATAAAQHQGRTVHGRSAAAAADSSRAARRQAANVKAFRGTAAKLNTTPQALEAAFASARAANPRLSRGNFIAANMLAYNLGARHPNITTAAILSGLQSGNSVGQTLQNLGLSGSEAKQARRDADRQAKDADKRVNDDDKRARRAERDQRERENSGHSR